MCAFNAMHCREKCIKMKCKWTLCTQGCWRSFAVEMINRCVCTLASISFIFGLIFVWRICAFVEWIASHSLSCVQFLSLHTIFVFFRLFSSSALHSQFLLHTSLSLWANILYFFVFACALKCADNRLFICVYLRRECRIKIRDDTQTFIIIFISAHVAELLWAYGNRIETSFLFFFLNENEKKNTHVKCKIQKKSSGYNCNNISDGRR